MKITLLKSLLMSFSFLLILGQLTGQRQMEKLNRGLVAVRTNANTVFVSWRVFGNDDPSVGFNLYRGSVKLNSIPITGATNYTDNTSTDDIYSVKPIVNGTEQASSESAGVWSQFYKEIPLNLPSGGTTPDGVAYTYSPNDCSVGDVDGDGEYEIIVKWDPSNSKDNSQSGYTGNVYLDAYKINGTFLWRIDLGKNIRAGAHYTQFMVYDLNGDGKAEIACKTAPGTKDGLGNYLTGDAAGADNSADYRNTSGYILSGPEYLTVFEGLTGKELQTINYEPARGTVSSWGDSYGNRVDRFLACIAYLDGKTPSLVMCRGYYTRAYLVAYKWNGSTLTKQWAFDSNASGNSGYAGQGCHNLCVGDVDGDGFDEIIYGSCTIDHNGTGLYTTGLGHGDAVHLSDFDPDRPGLEVWQCHENTSTNGNVGGSFRDAKTGTVIWKYTGTGDIGRGLAANIDASVKGMECWAAGSGLYSCTGSVLSATQPVSDNFGIWWDGDDQRELLDGDKLDKYGTGRLVTLYNIDNATYCNGTKRNPNLQADILGDWREEIILHTSDNTKLILFTTTTPTTRRLFTLMHDPMYRLGVAWQNVAYNQPPDLSFYLGEGMVQPASPSIIYSQFITFNALPSKLIGDATFDLTATSSSGLPVSYISSNPSVASINGSTITINGAGTTTIKASQDGDNSFKPASDVFQVLTVKAPQTISFGDLLSKKFGDTSFDLTATSSSGLAVSYTSSNINVATISGSTVTIVGAGTTNITASQSGNNNYNAATDVTEMLTVDKASQVITLNDLPSKKFRDAPFDITAGSSSGLAVSYSCSNANVATINGSTVTIIGAGTTNITASQAGDNNYNTATDVTQMLQVDKASQTIAFNDLPSKKVGEAPFDLAANSSSGLAVSYSSSNTNVATINGATVTIIGAGTTNITASQAGDNNYNAASDITKELNVMNTGVVSLTEEDVLITPNPVQEHLKVTLHKMEAKTTLEIYALSGVRLYRQNIIEKITSIPMGQLLPGIYTIKIISSGNVLVKQIIKQ